MFHSYTEEGPALLTDTSAKIRATFVLENTSMTVANTLRRCILTETRSVGFRADLTKVADPGVRIRKNTSVIFNEMLAHRLTLLPLGVRNLEEFDASRYECVLRVRNDKRGPITEENLVHVKAGDFLVREKDATGAFQDLTSVATAALFPPDPITRDTSLLLTLRPQWNPEQPPEEIDLTAYPVIGRGREFMGFCPVSQCSFANTLDEDPVRQEEFFKRWLADYKKITDPTTLTPELTATHRQEWSNMAIQRCFVVDDKGQPNSFTFTVESVGIRPVQDIVLEGIRAVLELVAPYTDPARPASEIGLTVQPADSRMTGVDVLFDGQEHTLGNLLQTMITELYLDTEPTPPDSPITYVGYKVRHPLHRVMTLRVGVRPTAAADAAAVARQVIAAAAQRAQTTFQELARAWEAMGSGGGGAAGAATEVLEGGG
jgi:DNA-directed RNA polymerase subunit L